MTLGFDSAVGKGCWFCETGIPIEQVQTKRGGRKIALCLECVMRWFPTWTVEQWELRHAPFADHLDDSLKAAMAKDWAAVVQAELARTKR